LQQPLGQVVPLHGGGTHAPLVQMLPPAQAMQATPLRPQAVLVFGVTQFPLLQQPFGQLAGAVQTPLVQTLVPVQATQAAPAVPH
jgi:hypothetical protein